MNLTLMFFTMATSLAYMPLHRARQPIEPVTLDVIVSNVIETSMVLATNYLATLECASRMRSFPREASLEPDFAKHLFKPAIILNLVNIPVLILGTRNSSGFRNLGLMLIAAQIIQMDRSLDAMRDNPETTHEALSFTAFSLELLTLTISIIIYLEAYLDTL